MRILIVAATTGYQTRAFSDAARRLGLEPVLATDRCHVLENPWGDRAIALRFEDPRGSAALVDGQFDAVVAVADRPALIASMVAERCGLRFHPPGAVEACSDKSQSRALFQRAGMLTPEFFRAGIHDDAEQLADRAPFPCVLKPLGLSASRGVIRANNRDEFRAALDRIRNLLEQPDIRVLNDPRNGYIQVESFIEGREFAVEGLVTDGKLQVLAIFDKPDPLDGPFFEETIYVTPSRELPKTQRAIIGSTQRAIEALGLTHGPVHAEMRVNDAGVWMLEVAARPIGGLCAKALRFDGCTSLEEVIIRHAIGEDVSNAQLVYAAAGVMMIPIPKSGIYLAVRGVEEARAVPFIDEVIVTAKPGQKLLRLPEGASYLGFLFANADQPRSVETALRTAHGKLRFEIASALRVMK